jgi:putative transposase
VRFAFTTTEKANYSVIILCRVMEVSRSGFYGWWGREPSRRELANQELKVRILSVFEASRATYGSPRIHIELAASGMLIGCNRMERLMREEGISAGPPKRHFRQDIVKGAVAVLADNVLDRDFTAAAPNQTWVFDITYIRTWQGWLFLAVVIDLFSRKVMGWSMAEHMRTELVLSAFESALGQRLSAAGLLHHSDRGSQYLPEGAQGLRGWSVASVGRAVVMITRWWRDFRHPEDGTHPSLGLAQTGLGPAGGARHHRHLGFRRRLGFEPLQG